MLMNTIINVKEPLIVLNYIKIEKNYEYSHRLFTFVIIFTLFGGRVFFSNIVKN